MPEATHIPNGVVWSRAGLGVPVPIWLASLWGSVEKACMPSSEAGPATLDPPFFLPCLDMGSHSQIRKTHQGFSAGVILWSPPPIRDIWQRLETCWAVTAASGGWDQGRRQTSHSGQQDSLRNKNYPTQNVDSAEVENPETDCVSSTYVLTDKMIFFIKRGKKCVEGNYVKSMLVDKFSAKKNKKCYWESMISDNSLTFYIFL